MPHHSSTTELPIVNTAADLNPVLTLLTALSDVFESPLISGITTIIVSLISAVQNIKRNHDECARLIEKAHEILYAIVDFHIQSETPGSLSPTMLHHLGKFANTLLKIHTFVEAQQERNKIKHFFHQSGNTALLKDCREGLQQAAAEFKIEGANIICNITEMQKQNDRMHTELAELISNSSDATASDLSSSIHSWACGSQNSSNSFSMLPAKPKIFHGRDSELKHVVEILLKESARIAILGGGGMGKTSLAKAALHHPNIVTKYQHIFFVPCDSATTSIELAALIGSHMGLKPVKDLTNPVVQYLSDNKSCLLILDNFETVWEPMESRNNIEGFLALITDIENFALVVTMRGAERPSKVPWTHPFLRPLAPLPDEAARQTFIDIAEDSHNSEDITQLLSFTDNIPLALNLIAHLVDYEGCPNVLARWETEHTSMLSSGYDRRTSLDVSISLSLSNPRMNSGAKELLSLLSILPDGLSDSELIQSKLPIADIQACRSVLLRTALAYADDRKRLRSLVPIREHMKHFYPAPSHIVHKLRKYFQVVLDLYQKSFGTQQGAGQINQIASNLGNLHQLLLLGLNPDTSDLSETINCIISVNIFFRITGRGWNMLMDHIPAVLPLICDPRVEAFFITEMFTSLQYRSIVHPEELIDQAIIHFSKIEDPVLESQFYNTVGYYYFLYQQNNMSTAMQFLDKALALSRACGDQKWQAIALINIANIEWNMGHYPKGRMCAREAQQLSQLCADSNTEARSLHVEGMCCIGMSDYKTGILLYQRARKHLELCGMSGHNLDHAIMSSMAEVHLLKSEYAEAYSIRSQIAENTFADQDANQNAWALLNLAEIDIIVGATESEVQQNLDKVQTRLDGLEYSHRLHFYQEFLGVVNLREKGAPTAKTTLQRGFNSNWKTDTDAALMCLEKLAEVRRWTAGDFNWSSKWTVIYIIYAKKLHSKLALYRALQFMGDVFLSYGDQDTAQNLFTVGLEGLTSMDIHHNRAQCMLRLGDISQQRGNLMQAVEFWEEARPLFEKSSQQQDVLEIDTRLAFVN
ncbi:hypothetical protein B0H14DRAFT_3146329 [Mycena olivaceomarginata]|nr:hypothetical protein B0H14DRAFT_3146329 [Mycena olivaceomarginata]